MKTRLTKKAIKHLKQQRSGFALISSILIMSLLMMVAVAMLSISSVEARTSGVNKHAIEAQANARMALMLAIGELQQAAGPDQRITATADIYSDDSTRAPQQGRSQWVGVWDTSNFTPENPDTKPFVKWLVSSHSELNQDGGANGYNMQDSHTIFTGETSPTDSVEVDKIPLKNASGTTVGGYAYWVDDLAVKADLAWNEIEYSNDDLNQNARISSAAGVDFGVFAQESDSPLQGEVNYPLEKYTAGASNIWLKGPLGTSHIDKLFSTSHIPHLISGADHSSDWLRRYHKDMTIGSRGVICDVKNGGLRRDLSIAFEMDDDEEAENADRFNEQIGEFVAGSDKYAAVSQAPGLPVKERFLFRETTSTGGPFVQHLSRSSDESNRSRSVVRGPTWWALRDYYNLYKKLSGTTGDYTMKARTYYPDRDTIDYSFSEMLDTIITWNDHFDAETRTPHQGRFQNTEMYLFRPAKSNYAPVNLGTTVLYSVLLQNYSAADQTAEIAIAMDPIFYLWNPYNRRITVDNLAVYFETGFPGKIKIEVESNGSSNLYDAGVHRFLKSNMENIGQTRFWGPSFSFLINNSPSPGSITLEPGEVVAASPSSKDGQSYIGYDPLSNDSGLIMTNINTSADLPVRVSVAAGETKINVGYYGPKNGGANSPRYFMETSLTPAGTTPADLAASKQIIGNQTQSQHMQLNSVRNEYLAEDDSVFDIGIDANTLIDAGNNGVKRQFGLFTYLMKPSAWEGNGGNPVDVFARFNPAPLVFSKDWWAAAVPNQVYNFVADQNANSLTNNNGINFGANNRNAFWGRSYTSSGKSYVPMANIPSSPLLSMADFANANVSFFASDPFKAIGNSWSHPFISPLSIYGSLNTGGGAQTEVTGTDLSWSANDALFDRYFLSGITPAYTIDAGGYRGDSLSDALDLFYGNNYTQADASPMLEPYIPQGKTAANVISDLDPSDPKYASALYQGYKKLAAYSLMKSPFNINSTSVKAWEAILRSNKGLDVKYSNSGGISTGPTTTPLPSSSSPSDPSNSGGWAGLARLTDPQITDLATKIVEEVKERGPFMSLSEFVNRKVGGTTVTNHHYTGAIQAAIDATNINDGIRTAGMGAQTANYSIFPIGKPGNNDNNVSKTPRDGVTSAAILTTEGIPTSVTQADVLRPIAPRMTARADTFRIRAYGEVVDGSGNIIASATCEVTVQRTPEYMNPSENDPWDDNNTFTSSNALSIINTTYGRRFQIKDFRWLSTNEL